jgi:organic hydroperoxide reductase OsmC/OhrA
MEGEPTFEELKQAEEMAHKADGYCIITNAVRGKVDINVEPTIAKG